MSNTSRKRHKRTQGLFDPSGTDLDKWLDGTWGTIPAGTSQADSSRFLQENLLFYERIIPKTNYGVTVGSDYVSTISLLPQFNGAVLRIVIPKTCQG